MVNSVLNFLIIQDNLQLVHLQLLQKSIQETVEATGDLSGNKMDNKISLK